MDWINKYRIFGVLITFIMMTSFQTLQPNSVAPSLNSECDKPSGLGFNFMRKNKKIEPNQKFGRLTTIRKVENYKKGNYKWICLCECGNEKIATTGCLNYGQVKSCGCLQLDKVTKHGQGRLGGRSSEYVSWRCMIGRCYSPEVDGYKHYGAKGISVCDRWRVSFVDFFADMGKKPTNKHTIERNNPLGNYEPSNCRWATQPEQDRNKTNTVWIEYDNERLIASDWAKRLGISCGRLLLYIKKNGVDLAFKYFTEKTALRFKPQLIKDIYLSDTPNEELSALTGVSIRNILKIKKRQTFKNITNEFI